MNKAIEDETELVTLTDLFLRYLKAADITHVFGIPGGLLFPFFDQVEKNPDFELIVSRHEEGAAFMADGFARAGGTMAVCAGTAGPGASNLITGVACAYTDGVPMLVVTGQAQSLAVGKGAAQETSADGVDIVSMFSQITKYSAIVSRAERLPFHLERALRIAQSGRPGPVHLNIPVDLWNQRIAAPRSCNPDRYRTQSRVTDPEKINQAVDVLVRAKRPAILAGSGITGDMAKRDLVSVAEQLGARVATTPRAKGVFPEDHSLSAGVLGFGGHQFARDLFLANEIDTLVTIGASLNETTTFNWDQNLMPTDRFIQIDIDPNMIGRNYPVDVGIVGDAETSLARLSEQIAPYVKSNTKNATWASMDAFKSSSDWFSNANLRQQERLPLAPQRWRAELQEVLPDNTTLFSDIGAHMLFNVQHFCINQHQRFILNFGFGSMGHGLAAPVGAAFANPDRLMVSITGDACFTMNGMEVLTALEYQKPVIWIVENNQMHGISWHGSNQLSDGNGLQSIVLKNKLDVTAIAKGMGADTYLVNAPNQIGEAFLAAVENASKQQKASVIEVLVDADIPPPLEDRSKSIAGFKNQ